MQRMQKDLRSKYCLSSVMLMIMMTMVMVMVVVVMMMGMMMLVMVVVIMVMVVMVMMRIFSCHDIQQIFAQNIHSQAMQ